MLFMNKPLIVVCNKIDLQPLDALPVEDMKLVMEMKAEAARTTGDCGPNDDEVLLTMSTLTDDGVIAVKNAACKRLLEKRVQVKMKSERMSSYLNRLHVAEPKPRDNKERPPCIAKVVLEACRNRCMEEEKRMLEKDLEEENGGAGVYSASLSMHYMLASDEWKEDVMPEILDGHNVYDFVDGDILRRLEELEREEVLQLEAEAEDASFEMDWIDLTPDEKEALAAIRKKKSLLIQAHRRKKSTAESSLIQTTYILSLCVQFVSTFYLYFIDFDDPPSPSSPPHGQNEDDMNEAEAQLPPHNVFLPHDAHPHSPNNQQQDNIHPQNIPNGFVNDHVLINQFNASDILLQSLLMTMLKHHQQSNKMHHHLIPL